eukprot:TRINITY_DN62685_c0_g1_i1.p1 TRINITY_DN62685_c0_g1~~TRINITY_DN62685_c0_g1_i1.p1  ORF type:complete len:217 (-),score=33.73 TRINITY_DN62685_c0_g1_i1:116-688(-)
MAPLPPIDDLGKTSSSLGSSLGRRTPARRDGRSNSRGFMSSHGSEANLCLGLGTSGSTADSMGAGSGGCGASPVNGGQVGSGYGTPSGRRARRRESSAPHATSTATSAAEEAENLEQDLRSMERIFEEELRRAAFRMADDMGLGVLSKNDCRLVLNSLAGTAERKGAVGKMELPEEVDMENFLDIAKRVL